MTGVIHNWPTSLVFCLLDWRAKNFLKVETCNSAVEKIELPDQEYTRLTVCFSASLLVPGPSIYVHLSLYITEPESEFNWRTSLIRFNQANQEIERVATEAGSSACFF